MPNTTKYSVNVVVLMLLLKDDKVLLMRRQNTGWGDGDYDLVGGHHDGHESLSQAVAREAQEEIGITIKPEDATFVHFLQYIADIEYLYSFYAVKQWRGEPEIKEPAKCDDLSWFPLDALPENIAPVTRLVIEKYKSGDTYTEFVPASSS